MPLKPSMTPPKRSVTTTVFVGYCVLVAASLAWGVYDYVQTNDIVTLAGVVALSSATVRIAFLSFKWFEYWGFQALSMVGGFAPFAAAWVGLTLSDPYLALWIGVAGLTLNVLIPLLEYRKKLRSVWRWQTAPWVQEEGTDDSGNDRQDDSVTKLTTDHAGGTVAVGDAVRDGGGNDGGAAVAEVADDGGEESGTGTRGVGGAAREVVEQERASAGVGELVESDPLEAVTVRGEYGDEQPNDGEPQDHEERGLDDVGDEQGQRENRGDVDEQQQEHSPRRRNMPGRRPARSPRCSLRTTLELTPAHWTSPAASQP
ncbi:hypothetical protein NY551_18890 [Curtobacterium flaccumfaciens pv. oortii]|uniref:hypothetical protein n=1 Tax=Curtobacterium flaccumfaciens TaxID=2035 RepID=UPI0026596E3E|nr:hypothetical protein [Curtobacterium flaccumfaciens]MCS5524807.1 hypothetical protein [Curtobacterium flaccumfaciens pv. oortii]